MSPGCDTLAGGAADADGKRVTHIRSAEEQDFDLG